MSLRRLRRRDAERDDDCELIIRRIGRARERKESVRKRSARKDEGAARTSTRLRAAARWATADRVAEKVAREQTHAACTPALLGTQPALNLER